MFRHQYAILLVMPALMREKPRERVFGCKMGSFHFAPVYVELPRSGPCVLWPVLLQITL